MDYSKPSRAIHICRSPECGCGLTRRDFLRLSALTAASVAAPLLSAGDARAQGAGSDAPVKIGYEQVFITASIGISLCPSDTQSTEELFRNADQALYAAKRVGRNQVLPAA